MSLASNFAVFKTGTYTWTVPSTGSYTAGRWVAGGADTVSTLDGTIQPATTEDLQLLAEGDRINGLLSLFTETIIAVDDRVTVSSAEWRVLAIKEHLAWQGGANWYKGVLAKVPRV